MELILQCVCGGGRNSYAVAQVFCTGLGSIKLRVCCQMSGTNGGSTMLGIYYQMSGMVLRLRYKISCTDVEDAGTRAEDKG